MDSIDDFERSGQAFGALVAGTRAEQWSAPTPCTEWDVRALLNHVVTGTQWFATMLRDEPAPDRTVDALGSDPAAAFFRALEELLAAFALPGAFERSYEHRVGPVSGERLAAMRTNEYLVHGWDLAVATRQPVVLPADLVPQCLALYGELLGDRERPAGGAFGSEVAVAPDAGAIDRLVAFFGRSPA